MKIRTTLCLSVLLSVIVLMSGCASETIGAEFKTVYPGVYDEDEQKVIDKVLEFLSGSPDELLAKIKATKAGEETYAGMELNSGLIPVKDYTPGNSDLLSAAYTLNPINPLYTDMEYAAKTKYGTLISAPLSININIGFPYMPRSNDVWVLSREEDPNDFGGLDHELTFYKPIYASDTLRSEITGQYFIDLTDPKGSIFRKLRVIGEGDMYNQKGEKVMSIFHSSTSTYKMYKDPSMAEEASSGAAAGPVRDWDKIRPIHKYTDADWAYIRELWSKEEMRGANTLYWEDVNIGDEPAWTCDGPVTEEDRWSGGIGMGVQKSTTVRDVLTGEAGSGSSMGGPPGGKVELTQDEYGMYHVESGQTGIQMGFSGGMPGASVTSSKHPNERSRFMNTQGRDFASRMITNWMGDDGWLYKICWRLTEDTDHNKFPAEYDRPSYLLKVPYLKEQGKFMNVHGMVGDVGITKGYVCDKYVMNGRYYIDLVVWCENIEGDIWAELYAIVELPSKKDKKS